MSLDVIQSYFVNTKTDNYTRTNTDLVSRQAMLSCKFLKKHGYTTVLYTSKNLLTHFKNHPYDEIIIIDPSEFDYVTKNHFWSGTKLICCEQHPNAYVHIDIDLFLIEDILSNCKNCDFIFFHQEPWVDYLKLDTDLYKQLFDSKNIKMYNAAIIGGYNYGLLKTILQNTLYSVKNQSDEINRIIKQNLESNLTSNWIFSAFVEQILLPNKLPQVSTVIDASECKSLNECLLLLKQHNVLHLWYNKCFLDSVIGIDRLIQYMEKYYFG